MHEFTPQQQRVFDLIVLGKTNRQIGALLGLSEKTVKAHVTAIYVKSGHKNARELIAKHYLDILSLIPAPYCPVKRRSDGTHEVTLEQYTT